MNRSDLSLRRGLAYGTLAALSVGGAALYLSSKRAIDRRYADLARRKRSAATVETGYGTVEYAVEGQGTPVLVSHGICGGFDQAVENGRGFLGEGYQIIGVSRFGYLGSDLPDDPTPANQADAFRDVLDHLGIDRAAVLAVSAGGPAALQFAQRHPERTTGLILVSAALPDPEPTRGPMGPPAFALRDRVFWLASDRLRSLMLAAFGIDRVAYRLAGPEERRAVDAVMDTLVPVEPRREGVIADTRVTNPDVVEHYDDYDLESIAVPTLLVHARDDPLAPFDLARRAAERIPDATLAAYEDGGHVVFGHADDVERRVDEFLTAARERPTADR